ncbi:PIG-L deacetylase family protein [Hymenobacter psychrophilus]|uniref:N-acetylglucosaminyl deacetylase, LmbE family n=1 Tax=Hymenobacter psychrophilus TaxID=651662 RepID=A0A1H3KAM0_9BACT|nr:PIG-L deacetylase family protein [Hymenobacter psychrophilus]SDY49153.1 N-acetylglucosaminyl deacetylase, LmbE family [Hymenobacter psychrophilus]
MNFDFNALPLQPVTYAATLGPTVVIAPHPDDESLGCGGLLALLARAQVPVWCVLMSDGTMSHPNSARFPAPARQALRETELRLALAELGLNPANLLTLRLPDSQVPGPDAPAGAAAVARLVEFFQEKQPATVLCPWRRDPHPDHRASSQLVRAALAQMLPSPRLVEYLVWAWERAAPADLPQPGEVSGWQLNISSVLAEKQRAIAAHASQLPGSCIDDDPAGFTLAPTMLEHFENPIEVYLEATA